MESLSQYARTVRVSVAAVAGTTALNSSAVDVSPGEAVQFEVIFGAITGTPSVKVQESDTGTSGWTDLVGSSQALVATDDQKIVLVDVIQPTGRYLRAVVTRAASSSVVDAIVARVYKTRKRPVEQGSTVVAHTTLFAPAQV